MFRKHVHTYSKGYEGASALRDAVNRIDDPLHFTEVVDQFFRENRQIHEGFKASSMSCEC
jgi:tRNA-dihydrouridine synthase B